MSRSHVERLRGSAADIVQNHSDHRVRAAARQVRQSVDVLLRDPDFIARADQVRDFSEGMDLVHEEIEVARSSAPHDLIDYLHHVHHWSMSLAGDPTTPPPRRSRGPATTSRPKP